MRSLLLLLLSAVALLIAACTPAKPPAPTPKLRVGKTTSMNCPDSAPTKVDDDEAHISNVTDHTIDRICILGTTSDESRAAIAHVLALHEGDKLDRSKVHDSLDALVELKSVEDASISAETRGEDAVVYVVVHERPRVEEVVFHGATVFGDAKLNEKNPIKRGAPLDRRVVAAVVRAMTEEYASVGYGGAAVETSIEPSTQDPNLVIVRFTINEGPQWMVRKLVFTGAAQITVADLLKATKISTNSGGELYDADRVTRASLLINALYYERGMLTVKVSDPQRDVASDGGVTLTWTITEGVVYRIGSLKLGKLGAGMEKELAKEIKSKPGDVFDRAKLIADIQHLKAIFEGRGQKVDIEPLTELDPKKKRVDLVLNVEETR